MDSRHKDIVKSVYKMFLSTYGFTEKAYGKTAVFLNEYHRIYPIDRLDLQKHFDNYFIGKIASLWLEETSILGNDTRVDAFALSYYELIEICCDNSKRKELSERLVNLIN